VAFQYSFQQIVNLKNSERTQAEWMLVESIGNLRREEHSLGELESLKVELGEIIAAVSAESVSVSRITMLYEYADHLDRQISLKHRDVEAAQRIVSEKRVTLSDRMLDEKVWTEAREKAYRSYMADVLKKEQDMLDEMATNRYLRA